MSTPTLPLFLRLSHKPVLVVGGGTVALRRVRALLQGEAVVTVVAPDICEELASLSATFLKREFQEEDVKDQWLVIAATNSAQANLKVSLAAQRYGALINRTDAADLGDVIFPAYGQRGSVSIALSTGGASASAAASLRDQLLDSIPQQTLDWLSAVAELRSHLIATCNDLDKRHKLLKILGGPEGQAAFIEGGADALKALAKI